MTRKHPPSADADKFILRLPEGMRDQIAEKAKANNRSMNAEMVLMLQQVMEARQAGVVITTNYDALAEKIAERVAAKIKDSS